MSRHPTIDDAKKLATTLQQPAVIVLAIDTAGRISGASYGWNRKLCSMAGRVLDNIVDAISDGRIEIPIEGMP